MTRIESLLWSLLIFVLSLMGILLIISTLPMLAEGKPFHDPWVTLPILAGIFLVLVGMIINNLLTRFVD